MRAVTLGFTLVLLAACSHDDKPPQTSPDVAVDPSIASSATATATAAPTAAVDAGHSACDAVRCRGGMVCQMVDSKPTCVAAP